LKDSTQIQITKPVARLVIKDLIQYDGLSVEMQTMQSILTETNNKLLAQTDLVTNLRQQIANFEAIVNQKDNQMTLSKELTSKLQTDLKKQKLKTKIMGGAGILAVAGVLVLIK